MSIISTKKDILPIPAKIFSKKDEPKRKNYLIKF
jgi:hypothetical protein